MANPEVLWNYDKRRDFLQDLRSFCQSLNRYRISLDLREEGGKHVYLREQGYELDYEAKEGAFTCPQCQRTEFEVIEGDLDGKPVLGLGCVNCETYGIVFPQGL